jgi:hypothetical protein
LPPELRNRIYHYLFAPVKLIRVNGRLLPVNLDLITIVTASDALLRTCRFARLEIRGIFNRSPARRKFWEDNSFVLSLDDSGYNNAIRLDQEYGRAVLSGTEDDDTILEGYEGDWPLASDLHLEILNKQMSAMKRLIVSVKADNGSCEAHLTERTLPCGTRYWQLDEGSFWNGILVPRGHLDQKNLAQHERIIQGNARFPMPTVQFFPLYQGTLPHVQGFPNCTMTVQTTGGSRYVFMEVAHKVRERWEKVRPPPVVDLMTDLLPNPMPWKNVKREQVDMFLEHCWLVFRALKNS